MPAGFLGDEPPQQLTMVGWKRRLLAIAGNLVAAGTNPRPDVACACVLQEMPLFFFPNRVNVLVQRLVAFQVFLVSLLLLIFGQGSGTPGQTGAWYVPRDSKRL